MRPFDQVVSLCVALVACASAHADTWLVTSSTILADTDLSHEGDDVIVEGATLTINGAHSFASLTVRRNAGNQRGVIRHDGNFSNPDVNGCALVIAGDAIIEGPVAGLVGSAIELNAVGLPPQTGVGAGVGAWAASGGGYGGNGGAGAGTGGGGAAYGSFTQPVDFGSGGGNPACCGAGGWGGGALRLVVGGQLHVDGVITANGGAGGPAAGWGGGAGAGGSVWIECAHFSGAGLIRADGGVGAYESVGGGGSGGRISVSHVTSSFTGAFSAAGGAGAQRGGAGSIYLRDTDEPLGVLIFDNGGFQGDLTPWIGPLTYQGSMEIRGGAALGSAAAQPLAISVAGDVTVEAAGRIDLTGFGEAAQIGPGAGAGAWAASGGGYGGHGGAGGGTSAGGESYGSVDEPVLLGSGGGHPACCGSGGSGGGALHLTVGGELRVDGLIVVDGNPGGPASGWGGGGGSGGSIWIECDTFTGSGEVRASGGEGAYGTVGGGGGGGRISIASKSDLFKGDLRAEGGVGAQRGGAGSVFRKRVGAAGGDLVYDNGGIGGAKSEWTETEPIAAEIVLRNGAILSAKPGHQLHVEVFGSLHVHSTASIDVTGHGYPPLEGPGTACAAPGGAPGAGHGGDGGAGLSDDCGGLAYGSASQPTDFGSGGGGTLCCNVGGWGGGVIRVTVSDVLLVDGVIAANGTPGVYMSGWGGGGGSGGSVWLECGELDGAGSIQAIGGAGGGEDLGGGGGGGRIAICAASMASYRGAVLTGGGGGFHDGGPGSEFKHLRGGRQGAGADLDGDGAVDSTDLTVLLGHWGCVNPDGACGACAGTDLNGDGVTDGSDLAVLLGHWAP